MPRKTKKQLAEERKEKERRQKAATRRSIWAVSFFALALLLAVYIYLPMEVPLKDILVNHLIFGLFGFASFLFPIFLGWLGVDALKEKKTFSTQAKLWMGLVLGIVISSFGYLFFYPGDYSFGGFFSEGLSDFWRLGMELKGGLLGGIIACPLIMLMSKVGFGILLVATTIITILFFFDLTLYEMTYPIRKLIADAKERRELPELIDDIEEDKENKRRRFKDFEAESERKAEEEQEKAKSRPVDVTPPEEVKDVVPIFVYDDVSADGYIDPMDISDYMDGEPKKEERRLPPVLAEPLLSRR